MTCASAGSLRRDCGAGPLLLTCQAASQQRCGCGQGVYHRRVRVWVWVCDIWHSCKPVGSVRSVKGVPRGVGMVRAFCEHVCEPELNLNSPVSYFFWLMCSGVEHWSFIFNYTKICAQIP